MQVRSRTVYCLSAAGCGRHNAEPQCRWAPESSDQHANVAHKPQVSEIFTGTCQGPAIERLQLWRLYSLEGMENATRRSRCLHKQCRLSSAVALQRTHALQWKRADQVLFSEVQADSNSLPKQSLQHLWLQRHH